MGDKAEGLLQQLEKDYCPPLDSALFTAIVCDYDLEDSAQVQQLRDTLDALKLSAWEQEDLPFDPSGTSGGDADGVFSERSGSQNGTARSRETDVTSLGSELSCVGLDDKGARHQGRGNNLRYTIRADGSISLSGASEEDKIGYLSEMFPSVDRFTIRHTLRKSDGDVDRAMDVLLNVAFFEERPTIEDGTKVAIPKGVDGFGESSFEDSARKKNRKRNGKNKHGSAGISSFKLDPALGSNGNSTNKWDDGQKDVDFICSRTCPVLKKEAVASSYHSNGASLPATIRALATEHAPKEELLHTQPVMVAQVAELTQEFPSIEPTLLGGLLTITRNSTSAAGELAVAMLTRPAARSVSELIKITTAPLVLDLEDDEPKRPNAALRGTRDYGTARDGAGTHFVASAEAFNKASAAYRRGRSDKLMGGAAAYYSAVGRDHLERAKRSAAAAAEAFVDSQSTSNALDLHGVSVQDAVRIASARVSQWWDSLGDAKYMRGGEAARSGFRIITGVGRHSHDGTSRLGPAVGKMLVREGWRVEVGEGVLTVTGVVRRR